MITNPAISTKAWQSRALFLMGMLICASSLFSKELTMGKGKFDYTILRVPKFVKPPLIDGKITPEEWKGAAAITGFNSHFAGNLSLPQKLQPLWYIAYDDDNLYLAMHCPVYPEKTLKAIGRSKTEIEVNMHLKSLVGNGSARTEIQFCTQGRANGLFGFYKFMANPMDLMSDQYMRYSIGQPGFDYESRASVKSNYNGKSWDQEYAFPLKDFGIEELQNGTRWPIHLAVCPSSGTYNYWTGTAHWLNWDSKPELLFDSTAPVVQFLSVGDWTNGNPELAFRVRSTGPNKCGLVFTVRILNTKGTELYNEKRNVTVNQGETKEEIFSAENIALDAPDSITGKDNQVFIDIVDASDSDRIYFHYRTDLSKSDDRLERFIKDLEETKLSKVMLTFAYMPSYKIIVAEADASGIGIDPVIIKRMKKLEVSLKNSDSRELARKAAVLGSDRYCKLVLSEFPPLTEGKYNIDLNILDENGNVILRKHETFERKFFPFENFAVGLDDTLPPPFTPLKVRDRSCETIGNRIALSRGGLPAQITNLLIPEDADRDMLAAPMQIILKKDGKNELFKADRFKWLKKNQTRARGEGCLRGGNLKLKLNVEVDYTGQYLAKIDMLPEGQAKCDSIDLLIPLLGAVDTFRFSLMGNSCLYNLKNPYRKEEGDGVLWDDLETGRADNPNKLPYLYVGNGERGFYWYTDSLQGFLLDYDKPYLSLERCGGITYLRIKLINRPGIISRPRHLHFAILPTPLKPVPEGGRYDQWMENSMSKHAGMSWGTVGRYVRPTTDNEWKAWAAGRPYPFTYKNKPWPVDINFGKPSANEYKDVCGKIERGCYMEKAVAYLQPEMMSFAGEWVDNSKPPLNPSFNGGALNRKRNGKILWPDPEQRSAYDPDPLVPSLWKFHEYWAYLAAKHYGIGGFWNDYVSLLSSAVTSKYAKEKGSTFIDDDGVLRYKNNIFLLRGHCERLARMRAELGVKNCETTYAPAAAYALPWFPKMNAWESLYIEAGDLDMFNSHGIDKCRAVLGKYSGLQLRLAPGGGEWIKKANWDMINSGPIERSYLAIALLFDAGLRFAEESAAILKNIGFFEPGIVWVPFWRSRSVVKADASLYLTAYKNDKKKYVIIAAANPLEHDVESGISMKNAFSASDCENGQPIELKKGKVNIKIRKHDFRLIKFQLK